MPVSARELGVSVAESDQGLFVLDPGLRRESFPGPGDKTFRPFVPDQNFLLPPSLDEWLPADQMARFIAVLVGEHLDLSRIHATYKNKKGGPPYDPRLMVRLLIFGYATGVRSSRKLEAAYVDVVAFWWLAGGAAPDFRSIARFRKRLLAALGHLFVQALALCQAAGMVKLGQVALDGTKVRANASRRKAMSYARMSDKEKILAQEVSDLMAWAAAIDRCEDTKFGKTKRGDELPAELARRETRLVGSPCVKPKLPSKSTPKPVLSTTPWSRVVPVAKTTTRSLNVCRSSRRVGGVQTEGATQLHRS